MSNADATSDELEFDPFAGPAIADTAPSTEPQREIWTATQTGSDASLGYNESVVLTLRSSYDVEALKAALSDLVARHESLRTTFSEDGVSLLIAEPSPVEPVHERLAALPAEEREARLAAHAREEVETPFDLQNGPLFRVRILELASDDVRVILTAHHIVCDGWSIGVLVKDLARFYNARLSGGDAGLAPAASFAEYARSQAEREATPQYAADERYWLEHLQGNLPVLELPLDGTRPPLRSYDAGRCDYPLDGELMKALKKVGATQRASLFMTLLAGFDALLFRLSRQEDLIVGIPAAGQSVSEQTHSLVGHCVNLLPIRCQLESKIPFTTLLTRVRATMFDAYEHQSYTFGTLLTKLPIARDPSRPPLVSVVFNVDRALTSESMGFSGLSAELHTTPRVAENFELFINAVELPSGMVIECQYNKALFREATVRRYLASFEQLLRGIVRDPSAQIGALPIVSADDSERLNAWNRATTVPAPAHSVIHRAIEAVAARTPDAEACRFAGQALSYATLNARANQLARALRAAGVRRGAMVGLAVERSPDMLVGLLGILKSGAAYVPLDPGYPRDRLAFMVEDAKMAALVTERKPHQELALQAPHVISLDEHAERLAAEDTANLEPSDADATADDVAYVIYTSGSTGKPKGVLVPHGAAVNLLNSVSRTPGMNTEERVLAVTTLSFDIALSELVLPLTVGATIVLASREVASDGASLLALVQSERVSFIDATPATYRLLLSAGFERDMGLRVICTGEAMPRDLARELVERVGEVWNAYGPTETTVWSTFHRVQKPVERILIGRPVDNTQIYVLDEGLSPTPIGVPGELYIAGAGVAQGYLGRPDLTRDRFVSDPFSDAPNARMYKTGDLGRYLESGELECLGRNDHQVKLRGYRVELGEIENALGQHAAVRQAAVIVREDRPGDVRLVGYVEQHAQGNVSDAELRAHLKRSLPEYMVPATYVRLQRMPLTPSGKVDRKALPAPEPAAPTSDAEFVAPTTPNQILLASLWKEALNVPRVSVKDDFFALGGHSLLASQVLARLRRDHGVELSFRKIFEAPTLEQLAALLDRTESSTEQVSAPAVTRRTGQGPAPLSLAQERIWLLEEMDPAQELVHNLPAAWMFDGDVKLPVLQAALDEIVRRHDMLRTVIATQDGRASQVVASNLTFPIAFTDLSHLPDGERERTLDSTLKELTREKFDLQKGPLFRSHLLKLAPTKYCYYTVRHSVIWDGWSFDIFLRELTQLYAAFDAGLPSPLSELPVTYADYASWQREFLNSSALQRQSAWWQQQLSGDLPELSLPTDRPRLAKSEHAGGYATFRFTRADAEAFTGVARAAGGTLFMVLFAAYNVMLHRYSGQSEILVGSPVRARNRPEFEGLIGAFINTVVLRTRLDPDMTFDALLARVRDVTLDSFSNDDMPLERLGVRPPVVRALFSLQDARARPPGLGSIPVTQKHVELRSSSNDMMIWMMDQRNDLLAVVNYSTELFDAATVDRFLRGFGAVLAAVVANPRARIRDLPIAAAEDLRSVEELGAPSLPATPSLLERLAQHAHGSAQAFLGGAWKASYAQLARRVAGVSALLAPQLGHRAPLVAVVSRDDAARAVGVLAALHAGAAFTVIDPALPEARRRALLSTLEADVILTADEADVGDVSTKVVRFTPDIAAEPTPGVAAQPDTCAWVSVAIDGDGKARCQPVSRGALFAALQSAAEALALDGSTPVLELAPSSAEISVFAQLSSLFAGAARLDAGERAGADARARGGLVFATEGDLARAEAPDFVGAKRVVVLGPVSAGLGAKLRELDVSVARLLVFPAAGFAPFIQHIRSDADLRKLGRVRAPARVRVCDDAGTTTPAVVPGWLWLGTSVPVASEKQRWSDTREPLVRTAERARFTTDGELELVAWARGTAWRDGQRLALGELSRALERHASIAEAHATAGNAESGQARLTVHFAVRPGQRYTETDLRRHLRAELPEALVPQEFVELDALPRDAQGAVDEAPLRAEPDAKPRGEYAPPRSNAERLIAAQWETALGLENVGLYDNFFDLGGYSLLCFKVIDSLEQQTGVRLSPRVLLRSTLEQAAAALEAAQPTSGAPGGASPAASAPESRTASATEARDPAGGKLFQKLRDLMRGGRS